MKIICEVLPGISIWADEHQYVVRVKKSDRQKDKHAECWYFPSLEYCFQEIFDHLCRERLVVGQAKTLPEVAEVVKAVRTEIRSILEPFTSVGTPPGARHNTAVAGQHTAEGQG